MGKYLVSAKCGHVGRNHYVVKTFPVEAVNGREAADLVRKLPRVKHDHKDTIINVDRVNDQEFRKREKQYDADPYFRCKNRQEQNRLCKDLILKPKTEEDAFAKKRRQKSVVLYHKRKIRDYKKYMTRYLPPDDYMESIR